MPAGSDPLKLSHKTRNIARDSFFIDKLICVEDRFLDTRKRFKQDKKTFAS